MTNAELIKGLRWCAEEAICFDEFSGEKCPYFEEKKDSCSVDEILHAAADVLEAADEKIADCVAAIEALDDSNDAYIKENERLKKRIAKLEKSYEWKAYAALEESIEGYKTRIAELEARLPKEGEWIIKPHGTYGQLRAFCSACGKHSGMGGIESNQKKPYCPNCGAKMKGVKDGES